MVSRLLKNSNLPSVRCSESENQSKIATKLRILRQYWLRCGRFFLLRHPKIPFSATCQTSMKTQRQKIPEKNTRVLSGDEIFNRNYRNPFCLKGGAASNAALSYNRAKESPVRHATPTHRRPLYPTLFTAKSERNAEGVSAKTRQQRPCRYERRKERGRFTRFRGAVTFAYAMDWPLNIGITITWTAFQTAGEHNEGHCLGRSEQDREKYTRDELGRLCRSEGLPFVALWGRDVGAYMGSHVHISMFWPSRKLPQLVAVIERISGSSADGKST